MADYIPPEIALEQRKIERRRKMAELLAQQDPMQGQMVSGHYVGASPVQGIANLATAYMGGKANRRLDAEETDLAAREQQILADEIAKYQKDRQGVVPGENAPLIMKPVSQRDNIAKYLAAQNPAIRDMAQYDISRMDTKEDMSAENLASLEEKKMLAQQRSDDLRTVAEMNNQARIDAANIAAGSRPDPRPSMDTIVDPKDPTRSIRVDMNVYDEAKYLQGDMTGVKGVSPKESDAEKVRVKKVEAAPKAKANLFALNNQWDVVDSNLDKAIKSVSPFTAGVGSWLSIIPATPQKDLARTLETIIANIGFDKLQSMRENSPTGGALGQVSDYENRLLQAVQGNLSQDQSPSQLRDNLQVVKDLLKKVREEKNSSFNQDFGDIIGSDGQGEITQINSDEEYDRLPTGAKYKGPDGITRVK